MRWVRAVGDVEKDFWLAFNLLRTPKDHAEFTIVRDWVRDALKVRRLFIPHFTSYRNKPLGSRAGEKRATSPQSLL